MIEELEAAHVDRLQQMFDHLPESDVTFIKEDVSPEAVASWLDAQGRRWVRLGDDGQLEGLVALLPLTGWSDHVAEMRLVVDPSIRGKGVGRSLAQHAVKQALESGYKKVVVELPAGQDRAVEMFLSLGFTGEALLRDHFRDHSGELQDLIMLAFFAEQAFEAMTAVGVADELGVM